MCLAKVYEAEKGDEPVLEDVAYMMIDGDRVEVATLFGDRKVFQGKVKEIDFMRSRVQLATE